MPRVLIVESNPAGLSARLERLAGGSYGVIYAAQLKAVRAEMVTMITSPYDGDPLPDLTGFNGVVFTGSSVDWNTHDVRVAPLADAMRAVFAAGLPVLGSCNGMQLAATLLGGRSDLSPNGREDGLARDIRITQAGAAHPLLSGRTDGYAVPCVHRDEVIQLPAGAVLLAGNTHSKVQAFAYEAQGVKFWGMQYHPELSLEFIGQYMAATDRLPSHDAAALRHAQESQAAEQLQVRKSDMHPDMLRREIHNWAHSL
jgi:GMP synthase (glutamine-hydrolysing)